MKRRFVASGLRRPAKKAPQRQPTYKPRFKLLKNMTQNVRNQSLRTTLCYSEQVTLSPGGAGLTAAATFAANGLYDPYTSGAGHQCAGFDQYIALYNEYLVVGSTIKVLFNNRSANYDGWVGVFLLDFSSTDIDQRVYMENGNGVWAGVNCNTTGNNLVTLKHSADITKFSHQDIANEDSFTGTSSTNPDDTHFYHVVVAPIYTGDTLGSVNCVVQITYDVIFRDPAKVALS